MFSVPSFFLLLPIDSVRKRLTKTTTTDTTLVTRTTLTHVHRNLSFPLPAIDSVGDRLVNYDDDDDDDGIGYNNSDEDSDAVLSRRRRMIGGMHRKVGGAYRGRPRPAVFRPRWRSGRTRSRQNTSPY